MKFSKKIIIPALALAAFTAIGVGSTYAIFTSEANTNIAVTSGKVSVTATVENVKLYSGVYNDVTEAYESVEQADKFLNGGTVTVANGVVTLDKVTPMDKVEFDVKVVNNSNVTAKYRTSINPLDDNGLMEGLNITLDGEAYAGDVKFGQWTTLEPTTTEISTMHVVVELPEAAGNQYQDKSCSIEFGVTAVQGNAHTEDVDPNEVLITSVATLKNFAKSVNTGVTNYSGKTVKLMNDIDLAGVEWKAIGNVTGYPSTTFSGTFDGNGHTISNMTVTDTLENFAAAGFFGSIVGTVKNLTIENPTVTSTHYAGAIVAYSSANASTIDNCHVIGGTVTSTPELIGSGYDNGDKVGGIAGYIVGGDTLSNCTVTGTTVTAYRDVGGLVGAAGGTVTNNSVKDVTVVQNNLRAYKTSVDTYHEVIGRDLGATASNNTYENVTIKSGNLINSVADLEYFRDFVNASNASATTGKTYVLGADIDLAGVNWSPIGDVNSYPSKAFNGTFDGNGHTISNMTVVDTTPNHACAGLFGSLLGTVKNLTVKNATVTSTHYAGGIVAYSSTSGCVIENCKVVDSVITSTPELIGDEYDNGDKVGGIIGYTVSGDKVTGCTVENTTVTAYRDLGGIVGCANGAVIVTNNTAKNVTVIQDNTNGYKTSVDTYHEIIGRDLGATASNNTATGCTVTSR